MNFIKNIIKNKSGIKSSSYVLTEKDIRWNRFIYEICSKNLTELNDIQKIAVLAFWYYAEMNSGGHSGYFDSFPNVKPEELVFSLVSIGADHAASNFNVAVEIGELDDYVKTDACFYELTPSLEDIIMGFVENNKQSILINL